MKKESIIVFFGGKSTEHDISIITGLQVLSNIDNFKYDVIPVYISKSGAMFTGKSLKLVATYFNFKDDNKKVQKVAFTSGSNMLFISKNSSDLNKKSNFKPYKQIDCAILCCHGVNGEDGTLQGLLELSNIPYTSPNVLTSAVSMDKIIMKDIFVANKINTSKYTFFYRGDFKLNHTNVVKKVEKKLNYPLFVKPANLGSSIGISKCKSKKDLEKAIEIAIKYDSRILIEESIENNIEVNCAVLGNSDYQIASNVEYPKSWSEFLNFEEKYIQRNKDSSKKHKEGEVFQNEKTKTKEKINTNEKIEAMEVEKTKKLDKKTENRIQEIAKKVFKTFDCSGVVRIDFLVEKETNKIYVNEINTIPGSLSFYLFKENGYCFKKLINRLIDIAKKEKTKKDNNILSYQSFALMNFSKGQKSGKVE